MLKARYMNARFIGNCKRSGCLRGGRIEKGEAVRFVDGVRGLIWHCACEGLPLEERFAEYRADFPADPTRAVVTLEEAAFPMADAGAADAFDAGDDAPTPHKAPVVAPPAGDLAGMIAAAVAPLLAQAAGTDEPTVRRIAAEESARAVAGLTQITVVEYRKTAEAPKVTGPVHKCFAELLTVLQAGESVLLWGPAGSGKSTAAHMAADLLGLGFDHIELAPMSPEYLLFGAGPLPSHNGGDPIHTRPGFCQAYGGDNGSMLYLIDECFNGSPALLTKLNTGLANGSLSYSGGTIERDPGFRCIVADNTRGLGPNPLHPERRQSDVAFLDRFFPIEWPIDESLERQAALAFNPDAARWVSWVQDARKAAAPINAKLAALCSPRASIRGAKLLLAGLTHQRIAESVTSGFDPDSVRRLMAACPVTR